MISPEVGRHVHYYASEAEANSCSAFGHCLLHKRPHAAIITAVHGDRMVNLAVFDANGKTLPKTNVKLVQPEDEQPSGQSFCQWMPFQITSQSK